MKQQDIGIVIAIVFFAAIFSYVLSSKVVSQPKKLEAQVVKPITMEFTVPDSTVFNAEAINPTKLIEIAPNDNNQPFADEERQ